MTQIGFICGAALWYGAILHLEKCQISNTTLYLMATICSIFGALFVSFAVLAWELMWSIEVYVYGNHHFIYCRYYSSMLVTSSVCFIFYSRNKKIQRWEVVRRNMYGFMLYVLAYITSIWICCWFAVDNMGYGKLLCQWNIYATR